MNEPDADRPDETPENEPEDPQAHEEEEEVPSLAVWVAAVFIVLFGSIFVCGGLFFVVREIAGSGSMQETQRTSQQLSIIRKGVRKYHLKNGSYPPAGNAELTKTLLNAQNRVLDRTEAVVSIRSTVWDRGHVLDQVKDVPDRFEGPF